LIKQEMISSASMVYAQIIGNIAINV
jgi:hypothetical protein